MTPFNDPAVEQIINTYSTPERDGVLVLRELIFKVARETAAVGKLVETLKWNQPAYLTAASKSGSTIRLGLPKAGGFALYTHCQTSIISDFQQVFPHDFIYEGNRAVHFTAGERLPLTKLELLVHRALTYHLKPYVCT